MNLASRVSHFILVTFYIKFDQRFKTKDLTIWELLTVHQYMAEFGQKPNYHNNVLGKCEHLTSF